MIFDYHYLVKRIGIRCGAYYRGLRTCGGIEFDLFDRAYGQPARVDLTETA